jgi:hypothetical protein
MKLLKVEIKKKITKKIELFKGKIKKQIIQLKKQVNQNQPVKLTTRIMRLRYNLIERKK